MKKKNRAATPSLRKGRNGSKHVAKSRTLAHGQKKARHDFVDGLEQEANPYNVWRVDKSLSGGSEQCQPNLALPQLMKCHR